MRKGLAIIFIIVIMSVIMLPALSAPVRAVTQYDTLMTMYPAAFWSWITAQWGSMGYAGTNLNEQLGYLNRNGNLDDYIARVYQNYQNDVQKNFGWTEYIYKFYGSVWEDIWNGDDSTLDGIKQFFGWSTDPNSPYYIDLSLYDIDYEGIKCWNYSGNDPLSYYANLSDSSMREYLVQYGITDMTDGQYYYHTSVSAYNWYVHFQKQDIETLQEYTIITSFGHAVDKTILFRGYIPVLSYINQDGSPDNNGNKYKLSLINEVIWKTTGDPVEKLHHDLGSNGIYTINASVSDVELGTLAPISFDADKLSHELTEEDITEDDYVRYRIDPSYIQAIQDLIDAINDNTSTIDDWAIPVPDQEVVTIETTNTIIREIVNADATTNPIDIDFPDINKFKMPTGLTTKFPFSIPFDIYRAFSMMSATAVVPRFEIPFIIGDIVDYTFVIDMQPFQMLVDIIRWFLLAMFILGLIMATRTLIKG